MSTTELTATPTVEGAGEIATTHESYRIESGLVIRRTTFGSLTNRTDLPTASSLSADPQAAWWKASLEHGLPRWGSRPLRAVDAFAGAGGLSLGLASAATSLGAHLTMEAAIDIDRAALEVHQSNHSTRMLIPTSADQLVDYAVLGQGRAARFPYEPEVVHESMEELAGKIDVLIGGPPCQGHSSLNNRSRHSDDRNDLYLVMPALAVALNAPAVLIENVPGVVRDDSSVVQSSVALLRGAGYEVRTGVLSAETLGWPQTRRRFFLLALRGTSPIDPQSQASSMSRDPLSLAWAIRNLPHTPNQHPVWESVPVYSRENVDRMAWLIKENALDLPNEIRPVCHQDGTTYAAVYGRLSWAEPAPTITTGFFTPGRGRFTHPDEPRTLNAREAARLQGFPDAYFSEGILTKVDASRSTIAKWIGDAVPMPLGHVAALSVLAPLLEDRE